VRRILVLGLGFALVAAAGCKSKPKGQKPPENVATPSTGSGSGTRAAPDLELPKSDGTAPKKTTKPLGKADFERLAKLEYPGFTSDVRTVTDNAFEVRQKTKDRPKLWAVVTITPCMDCIPLELDKWKAKTAELKAVNLEGMKDTPGVDFEVGETVLNGQKLIYTYQIGVGAGSGEGGGTYSFTNTLYVYFNDGVNQVRVAASYKDDPVTKDRMLQVAPKSDLSLLALSFLDVYSHEWAK
jgi:hypothetical protein